MFKRSASIFLIATLCFGGFVYFRCARVSSKDRALYRELVAANQALHAAKQWEKTAIEQTCQEVHKEFWPVGREPISLIAENSKLSILQKKEKLQIEEKLGRFTLRSGKDITLFAKEGICTHPGGEIFSQDIELRHPELVCTANQAKVFMNGQQEIDHIAISGNVHLFFPEIQGKAGFAIAESALFYPETQICNLSGKGGANVIFWQEGSSLSAREILVKKDPATAEEVIEGKGHVHLAFTLEEQGRIDQWIAKYFLPIF